MNEQRKQGSGEFPMHPIEDDVVELPTSNQRCAAELRAAIARLRRTPMQLADLIPLLQKAADSLDRQPDEPLAGDAYAAGYGDGFARYPSREEHYR